MDDRRKRDEGPRRRALTANSRQFRRVRKRPSQVVDLTLTFTLSASMAFGVTAGLVDAWDGDAGSTGLYQCKVLQVLTDPGVNETKELLNLC